MNSTGPSPDAKPKTARRMCCALLGVLAIVVGSCSTAILYKSVGTPKLTPAERRKARRLEIAQAKALADALLENESTPSGIQDELDEMYGDDDGEF